jgi:hypothetical protein
MLRLMSSKLPLGRLERVPLRNCWAREDIDFTPWLAQPENIAVLGNAIGLRLEVMDQEVGVGPYRADIVCQELATEEVVIIENQLEGTDHTHLGQILTYAAGLGATYMIWVSRSFTDEHRASLDWLNEHTDSRVHFFGLEIELWRIEASPVAPKFNVVAKPNEWVRAVTKAATVSSSTGPAAELKQLWSDCWTGFRAWCAQTQLDVDFVGGGRTSVIKVPYGDSGGYLQGILSVRTKEVYVGPRISATLQAAIPPKLDQIKTELGDGVKTSHGSEGELYWIHVFLEIDVEDQDNWPQIHAFFAKQIALQSRIYGALETTRDGES